MSRKKLTKQEVNARLKGRGIKLVGEYEGTLTKARFKGSCEHEWMALPNDVMRGTGCLICSGKAPLSADIVNERIADRGIVLIGGYVGTRKKTQFRGSCGHEWLALPTAVMDGSGCPTCAPRTDNNIIYIWKVVGVKNLYKIGITSDRLGEERIHYVAKVQGMQASIEIIARVENALVLETKLLLLGKPADHLQGHGRTEFRFLTSAQLKQALKIIASSI
jgi:hypothetical protein